MSKYPKITDPEFSSKLYRKREFRQNVIPKETRTMEEVCSDNKILPHQKFASRFINPDTPYNGALFIHSTGSGKTILSLLIAENFRKLYSERESFKKILILVKNDKLQDNFEKTLQGFKGLDITDYFFIPKDTLINFKNLNEKDQDSVKRRANKLMNKYYEITTYDTFLNRVKGPQELNGRLVIIDEVHNFRADNDRFKQFDELLSKAEKVILVLLTWTPMIDSVNEIADVLNLLNKGSEQIPSGAQFSKEFLNPSNGLITKEGAFRLAKLIKGKVSYLGPDKITFPYRKDLEPFKSRMSEFQYEGYKKAKADASVAQVDVRQASNFVFPDMTFGSTGLDLDKSTNFIDVRLPKKLPTGEMSLMHISLKPEFKKQISTIEGLRKFSCKFADCIENLLKKAPEDKAFVYSRFVSGGGIVLFSLILPLYDILDATIITGNKNFTKKIKQKIASFNDGTYKIILGSDTIAEGLDFKGINEVHILNPEWTDDKMEQLIGRAVRNCSHVGLKNKTVKVYKYWAVYPNTKLIDEEIYTEIIPGKSKSINSIKDFLIENSFDRQFNKNRNNPEVNVPKPIEKAKASVKASTRTEPVIEEKAKEKLDDSTYELSAIDALDIRKKIIEVFKTKLFVSLNHILSLFNLDLLRKKDIYSVLSYILDEEIEIEHKAIKGYLIYRKDMYIFQPYDKSERASLNSRLVSVKEKDEGSKRISLKEFIGSDKKATSVDEEAEEIEDVKETSLESKKEVDIKAPLIGFYDPSNGKFKILDARGDKGKERVGGGVDQRTTLKGAVCKEMKKPQIMDLAQYLGLNPKGTVIGLCNAIEAEMKNRSWVKSA